MSLRGKKNKFNEEEWDVVVQDKQHKSTSKEGAQATPGKKVQGKVPSTIQKTRKKQLIGVCVGCGIFICLFVVTFILMAGKLNHPTVYKGITLNGQSVAGLSREELSNYIYTRYVRPLDDAQVVLEIDAQRETYVAKNFLELPDVEALTYEIYKIGHQGNLFSRLFTIYELSERPKNFTVTYTVKQEKISEILALTDNEQYVGKIEPSYVIEKGANEEEPDRIVFTYGRDGLEINDESLKDTFKDFEAQLCATFSKQETAPGGIYTVKVEPKKTEFRRIMKVNILNALELVSKDATIEKISDKGYKILPEFRGKYVDHAALDAVLTRVNAGTEREETQEIFELPPDKVIFTQAFYEEVLFRDVLGESSNVNAEDLGMGTEDASEARGHNIEVMAEALNGIILLPNESFNFRTVLAGIAPADFMKAYESYEGFEEKVQGGGISQVSSALYSALCLTELSVAEVYHYDYIPTFGMYGFDAYMTVSGEEDLVFTNSYSFPIRIDASYANRRIKVRICGTKYRIKDFAGIEEDKIPVTIQPESVREIFYDIVTRVEPETQEHEDPDMPQGSSSVFVTGIPGYTLNLYQKTTVDDKESSYLLAQVTYKVRNEQKRVGTGTEGA